MNTAQRIALYQLGIAGVAALLWGCLDGLSAGIAAGVGGCISALLTFYVGILSLGRVSSDPKQQVMNFYRAQSRKFALAVVLFGLSAKFMAQDFAPLIITFAVSLTVYWFALLWKDNG